MTIKEKISALRKAMTDAGINAYVVPSNDPHLSEYVADFWKCREWISGFTGSAGTIVITDDKAGLWVDSRYYLQGTTEIEGTEYELHKMGMQGVLDWPDWLASTLSEGSVVGASSLTTTVAQERSLSAKFKAKGLKFKPGKGLIGQVWKKKRPGLSRTKISHLTDDMCGQSKEQKLTAFRKRMKAMNADAALITGLDEIAWILNLRGKDVEYNPVFYSYLWIEMDKAWLYVNPAKVSAEIKDFLIKDNVKIKRYAEIFKSVGDRSKDKRVLYDPQTLNYALHQQMKHKSGAERQLPTRLMKALKNPIELKFMKEAMIRDGVALVRLFRWLEKTLENRKVSEHELGEQIAFFRSKQGGYVGESFGAIVGYKGNGAIVHYRAQKDKCAMIEKDGMLLVDSGGQYEKGTTDITRTLTLGEPTAEQKMAYTMVLKGHIALAKARFPKGTKGVQLDTLARMHLWSEGLNFGHGTGHGVGFYLNVHEPPQGFVADLNERGVTPMRIGMLTSNEPGFYKSDEFGIRIENLVVTVADRKTPYGDFLRFDTVTLYPLEKALFDRYHLRDDEVSWINSYHRKVFAKLSPRLNEAEKAWLEEQCSPIH
jgi:Xaa-Pro aminopeptidase